MTVYLLVCFCLFDYANTDRWIFLKNQKMCLGPIKIPLSFESDVDHHFDAKKSRISHLLIITSLGGVMPSQKTTQATPHLVHVSSVTLSL